MSTHSPLAQHAGDTMETDLHTAFDDHHHGLEPEFYTAEKLVRVSSFYTLSGKLISAKALCFSQPCPCNEQTVLHRPNPQRLAAKPPQIMVQNAT